MCCGKKRAEEGQTLQINPTPKAEEKPIVQPQPESDPRVYFQYIGAKGLTVIGPMSRRRYRFESTGVVLAIDPMDKRALASVSVLRQVSKVTDALKEF